MWLVKTEPETYGWADLERDGRTRWDGVRNPVAQRNLKAMKVGDEVLVYHTGKERAVVARARVAAAAYPDPGNAGLVAVDLEAVAALPRAVGLDEIKAMPALAASPLVRQGRLSVVPLDRTQWDAILARSRA
jgi:predicted RNA-binding protein with PUA-like domain